MGTLVFGILICSFPNKYRSYESIVAPPLDAGYTMLWNTQKMYCGSTIFSRPTRKESRHLISSASIFLAQLCKYIGVCTTTACTSFSRDNMTCNALERSITRSFILCEAALEGLPALFNLC